VRPPASLEQLSMGMSHDFEVAIQEGATWIRVGTALSASARRPRPCRERWNREQAERGQGGVCGRGQHGRGARHGHGSRRTVSAAKIFVSDVRAERIARFEKDLGVRGGPDNVEAVKGAQIVVMAVKPQVMDGALAGLKAALGADVLVISIAAGISTDRIEKGLGEGRHVVRAMPNTPALVRAGAAAICGGGWATEQDLAVTEQILGAVGVVVRVREEDMDAVTAVSGSGRLRVLPDRGDAEGGQGTGT